MSGFKQNDRVLLADGQKGRVVTSYAPQTWYVVQPEHGFTVDIPESSLKPTPSAPLGANGQEIGIGDLVQYRYGEGKHEVGRIARWLGKARGFDAYIDRLPSGRGQRCVSTHLLTILEKAPPPQITLGSRVRFKKKHPDFPGPYVITAGKQNGTKNIWSFDGQSFCREDELELIE